MLSNTDCPTSSVTDITYYRTTYTDIDSNIPHVSHKITICCTLPEKVAKIKVCYLDMEELKRFYLLKS